MSRPLIGVPGMWSDSVHGLRFAGAAVAVAVLEAIDRAGGEPVIIFPGSSQDTRDLLGRFDAVLVPGGSDIDPARYGQEPDANHAPADYAGQDEFEAGVISACLDSGVPLLAICRGMQLLNVTLGGSLVQHLEGSRVGHRGELHDVAVAEGSLLHGVTGERSIVVSSYHHQAVGQLGSGLRVTASAADGVVEALEVPGSAVLAVQWHPEDDAGARLSDQLLFEWLVAEADQRRAGRRQPAVNHHPEPASAGALL
ncbi:gamma-glutamyl-gamma-aminobutyrate hydrolase family protein [Arthrobacter sp. H-02-3]|uniref:gamma-glutamyl-gamma-aminobutyrate hydrolase family protein n=1 Tax=Arthrobacter sp. H-02-3 TaxID=2703675 RepID=UPI000DD23D74|nr:gamma-glutamyl-gamma-aminobutyrate hydrolase family protein [Arthrobacter sp. H-02-3]PVZ53668.1 peptidase C26 [Arthrobacter sp. H-02-3]